MGRILLRLLGCGRLSIPILLAIGHAHEDLYAFSRNGNLGASSFALSLVLLSRNAISFGAAYHTLNNSIVISSNLVDVELIHSILV